MGILNRGSCFTSAPSASRSKVLAHAGIVAVSVLAAGVLLVRRLHS